MGSSGSTRTTAADGARQRATRLRRAKQIWAQLRPHEKRSAGRSVKGELSFSSLDQIAPEIGFRTQIQAIEIGDALVRAAPTVKIPFGADVPGLRKGDVSVRAHGALYDERTLRLASQAEDRDIANLPFLEFDIHAVCCQFE